MEGNQSSPGFKPQTSLGDLLIGHGFLGLFCMWKIDYFFPPSVSH